MTAKARHYGLTTLLTFYLLSAIGLLYAATSPVIGASGPLRAEIGATKDKTGKEEAGPVLDRDDLIISLRVPKTVIPGQFETFILQLSNDFDHPLDFAVSVDKPSSWRFMSMADSVHLEPGEKKSIVFLLDVDRACEIGKKNLTFTFLDKKHNVKIEEVITTTVQNIHEVHTRAVRKPAHLMGGEKFEVDFVVRNLGNCYESITVASENGVVSVTELLMAPNSTQYVKIRQVAPQITQAGYIASDIILTTEYSEKPIRERVSLKAFPKTTRRTDRFHRFPIDASLIYFGAKTSKPYQQSWQLELTGKGYIDQKERHFLNVVARGPSRFSIARVGNYDQYSVEYRWKQDRVTETQVRVGDFSYSLTPLTEMYRWARGVGVAHLMRKWEIGGFYNQPRFFSDISSQYGAYAKFSPRKFWEIQASAMQKQLADTLGGAFLGSLKNTFQFNNHHVTVEYSAGARKGAVGSALNFDLSGRIKDLSYTTQNIYAAKDYPGFYSNSLFTNSNLRYRKGKWGVNLGFSYNDANPAQDTIFTASPYSTNSTLGLTHYFSKKLRFMVNYIYRFKEDRFPTKKFSYRENAIRYSLAYKDDYWNIIVDGEAARTENLLIKNDDNLGNTYNVRARIDREVLPSLTVGGFGQYLYTNRYDYDLKAYVFYGGNVSFRPTPKLRFRASYRNNYLIDEYNSDRTLLDFEVAANFKSHRISVTSSHAIVRNTVDRKDFFISARYTYHLNAPVSRKAGLYPLSGILKSKNSTDAGGVIINIAGQSVITDAYGRFVVNDLPPGVHYLHIDKGSLGIGLITDVETPLAVEIFPTTTNYVNIEILRSGAISGRVNVDLTKKPGIDDEPQPLKIIKATNGDRELLTYTDDNGNYSFKAILPGEWTVRVIEDAGTQRKWSVFNNNQKVDVAPSETEKVNFEVGKKERKIKFSNQSVNLKIKKD